MGQENSKGKTQNNKAKTLDEIEVFQDIQLACDDKTVVLKMKQGFTLEELKTRLEEETRIPKLYMVIQIPNMEEFKHEDMSEDQDLSKLS